MNIEQAEEVYEVENSGCTFLSCLICDCRRFALFLKHARNIAYTLDPSCVTETSL